MYLQIEHPLKCPPEPNFPRWYNNCPCCPNKLDGDETFIKQDGYIIGCSSCIKEDYDEDVEICPVCDAEVEFFIYKDRKDNIVGCSECIECTDPEYEYILNCLNGEI